ncbi:MAG: PGF-CTERM sorting domain-containing protein, partial [Candidatus Methanoperedens sp.]|nr:PGF-CTERM sorting domain-containing protein [Candidatus Methanoperedens sp.]
NLPILWHSFNLPNFQNVTDTGIVHARNSQADTGLPRAKPSTPGFEIILSLAGIISIYLLMHRRR